MRILLSVSGLVLAFLLNTASAQPAWTEASDSNLVPGKPIKASQIKEIRDAIGWNVSGGNAYRASGNVGIGTTSPSSMLHLSSTKDAILTLEADSDNATETDNPRIIFSQDGGIVVGRLGYVDGQNRIELINQYTGELVFGTSNSEKMRINTGGNVGIGTTSPGRRLHVAGDGIRISNSSWNWLEMYGGHKTLRMHYGDSTNDLRFGRYGSNFGSWEANPVRFDLDAPDSSLVLRDTGNVGIGTTSPTSGLHIARGTDISSANDTSAGLLIGTGGAQLAIDGNEMQAHNGTSAIGYTLQPFGGTIHAGSMSSNSLPLESRSTGEHKLRLRSVSNDYYTDFVKRDAADSRPHAFDIYNRNNGSWVHGLSILNTGNVGIGTSSPDHKFHVRSGNAVARFDSSGTSAYIRLAIENDINKRIEWANRNGRTALWNPNTGDAFNIVHSSGNVGIGTTAPIQKLDVRGNIRATGNNIINNGAPSIYLQDTNNRSGMIHMNGSLMYFLRGSGNNSLGWAQTGGRWPLYLNMENNDAHFGGDVYIKGQKVGGGGGGGIGDFGAPQNRSLATTYTESVGGIVTASGHRGNNGRCYLYGEIDGQNIASAGNKYDTGNATSITFPVAAGADWIVKQITGNTYYCSNTTIKFTPIVGGGDKYFEIPGSNTASWPKIFRCPYTEDVYHLRSAPSSAGPLKSVLYVVIGSSLVANFDSVYGNPHTSSSCLYRHITQVEVL